MKRWLPLLLVLLSGCSTAPCADFLDYFFPPPCPPAVGRGGVCNPLATQPAPPPVVGRPGLPEPPPPEPPLPR
jgi:hypothetical protein